MDKLPPLSEIENKMKWKPFWVRFIELSLGKKSLSPSVLQLRSLQEECLYPDTERWWTLDTRPRLHQHSTQQVDTIHKSSRHTFSIVTHFFLPFFSLLIISLSNSNQASNEQLNCNTIVWSQWDLFLRTIDIIHVASGTYFHLQSYNSTLLFSSQQNLYINLLQLTPNMSCTCTMNIQTFHLKLKTLPFLIF